MSEPVQTRVRWPVLFQESERPLFILNRTRRLKFINAAFEKLAKTSSDEVLGKACLRKGPTEPLYRTLAPPGELASRSVATVRRAAPPQENGPPWWDVTFIRLAGPDSTTGILGIIDVIAATTTTPAKSASPLLGMLRKRIAAHYPFELFSGASLLAEQFRTQLRNAASSDAPVWLSGEPGSGKETAARVIHHNSPRREQPFVKIDCPALQPYLIEAILFGTGGLAPICGTLFLKNPAALPRDLQAKLAERMLAGGPRLISSSPNTAVQEVSRGALRPEFAIALSTLELSPRPLRERFDELPRIVEVLFSKCNRKGKIDEPFFQVLRAHRWPGNFRELTDAIATLPVEGPYTAAQLPRYLREKLLGPDSGPQLPRPSLDAILEAVEKKLITQAMADHGNNQAEAARTLGIHRARLIRRLAALGLAAE